MEHLTDMETRVLGVIEQRSGLDIEQIASAARLPVNIAITALEGLGKRRLVEVESGKFGATYELNRSRVQELFAA